MQILESLRKLQEEIAAQASGQVKTVRYVQGRQMYFLNQNQMIFLLPHIPEVNNEHALQVLDPSSPDYGMDYVLADMHPADGSDALIP